MVKHNNTIYEICYKCDDLGDPMINDHHAVALGLCTYEDLNIIYDITKKVNEKLIKLFNQIDITLVDFKIEFGRLSNGTIVLADEISPDTARLWDKKTNDKLDIKNKGIKKKNKNKEGYDLVIDTRIISVSELLNIISKKITIEDIEIDHESIDSIIVKLYEDYKI